MGTTDKGPKVGQPGEQDRTSQQNAGSTEGGGTRNADSRTTQGGEDLKGTDIERPGAQGKSGNEASGSRPR